MALYFLKIGGGSDWCCNRLCKQEVLGPLFGRGGHYF